MQKKIIALAIAAAVSAPAFAETMNVNIYGTADLSYDFIDTGTSAAGVAGVNKRNVSSNVSKIGFKGSSKDMGRGFVAIWQVEQQINMDNNGGNTFATRNTLVDEREIRMSLLRGPFDYLEGVWSFTPLRDDASKIALDLRFEMSGKLANLAFGKVFGQICDAMVTAFCERAKQVYG